MNYKDRLKTAEKISHELGLNPKFDFKDPITGEKIKLFKDFCSKALIKMLIERFGKGNWNKQFLNIAPQVFAILQKHQVPCELVYGQVKIRGNEQFNISVDTLKEKLNGEEDKSGLAMHVWINVGKDYIIDPTISSRIHKYYDRKCPQNTIFNGKPNTLKKQKIEYIPMLAGAKYLDITCNIPLVYQAKSQMV